MIMKDNASLEERLKDVEHQNLLLEGETDTIGNFYLLLFVIFVDIIIACT